MDDEIKYDQLAKNNLNNYISKSPQLERDCPFTPLTIKKERIAINMDITKGNFDLSSNKEEDTLKLPEITSC